jgi:uncharacterized protein YbjT (DUF2867 family)
MYVILGATGRTGSVVAETLLAQNQPVRVVARSAEKAAAWKSRGAEVAVAGIEDSAALAAAFRGATAVYALIPPDLGTPDALARGRRITDAIAAALDASKVSHVVLLSSIGAQLPERTGPILALHHAEERLAGTSAALTAIRAGYFMENWAGLIPVAAQNGILPTALALDRKLAMVATRDIGTTAAAALLGRVDGRRNVIELAGPEDLSPIDVAAKLGGILDKPVKAIPISLDDLKKAFLGMGASADTATRFAEMTDGLNAGYIGYEGKGARLVRGTTKAETVLAALAKQPAQTGH